jgi:hypothetical protein
VLYALFAAWFAVAAVRVSELLKLPAWPALLAGFGSLLFREHIGAGTVDVLLTAQVTTLVALYLGWARGTWQTARSPAWVLGAAVFAAVFTKLTGLIGPLLLLGVHRVLKRKSPQVEGGVVPRALAIAALLLLPFLLEQGYTELRIGRFRPDPREVNLSVRQTPALLATDADLTYRGGGLTSRPRLMQLRFWNSYDVPATLRVVFTVFLVGCLAFSLGSWFARAVLPVLVPYALVWGLWSSYDQRNLFAALPFIAIVAALGARRAWRMWPAVLWQSGVALMAGLFLILAGGGLLRELQARAKALGGTARERLAAIDGTAEARIDYFYPQYAPDFHYLAALAARTRATHVLVTSPMFRFFENGAHALSLWPYERIRPGDVFAGHEYHRPPEVPGWVLVKQGTGHRIWVFDPRLEARPVPPAGSHTVLTVPADDLARDGYFSWHADLVSPAEVGYAPAGVALDPASSIAQETLPDGTTRFSGVLAAAAAPLPETVGAVSIVVAGEPESLRVRRLATSAAVGVTDK